MYIVHCTSPYCTPLPFVSIEVTPSSTDILYNGDSVTLICDISLEYAITTPSTILSVTSYWTRNSKPLSSISGSRITTNLVMNNSTLFKNALNISNLNYITDNGEYVCIADVKITDESIETTISTTSSQNVTGRFYYFILDSLVMLLSLVHCTSPYCTSLAFVSIEVTPSSTDILYNGNTAVLICAISFAHSIATSNSILLISSHWRRNSRPLSSINDSRITTDLMMNSPTLYTGILNISTANDIIDSGEYQCVVQIEIVSSDNIMTTILANASFDLVIGIAPPASSMEVRSGLSSMEVRSGSATHMHITSELSMTIMPSLPPVSQGNLNLILGGSSGASVLVFAVVLIVIVATVCGVIIRHKKYVKQW